jgi:hypothetical protein
MQTLSRSTGSEPLTASNDELLALVAPYAGLVPRGYFATFSGAFIAAPFAARWSSREELSEVLSGDRYIQTTRPKPGTDAYFEQANIVRSISAAVERYTLMEVGGGVGPRAVDCALLIRKLRPEIKPLFVIVEPVPTYLQWCRHHFRVNGLRPEEHWILPGCVSTDSIPALFYLQPQDFGNSGSDSNIFAAIESIMAGRNAAEVVELLKALVDGGLALETHKLLADSPQADSNLGNTANWTVDGIIDSLSSERQQIGFVNSYTLESILAPLERVDFMDVDIQSAEGSGHSSFEGHYQIEGQIFKCRYSLRGNPLSIGFVAARGRMADHQQSSSV